MFDILSAIPFWLISSQKIITIITTYVLLQTDLGWREEDVTWYRVFYIITTLITTIVFTTTIIINTLDGEADLGEREELLSSDFLFMKIDLGGSGVKDNRIVETSKSLVSYPPGIGDNLLFDRSKIITASSPPFCRGRLQRRHYQIHCQQPAIFFVKSLHFLVLLWFVFHLWFVICIYFQVEHLVLDHRSGLLVLELRVKKSAFKRAVGVRWFLKMVRVADLGNISLALLFWTCLIDIIVSVKVSTSH